MFNYLELTETDFAIAAAEGADRRQAFIFSNQPFKNAFPTISSPSTSRISQPRRVKIKKWSNTAVNHGNCWN